MHPVLDSLRSTDRQWLIDTLYAFNSGNVERFQTLKASWGQQVRHGVWGWLSAPTLDPVSKDADVPLPSPGQALGRASPALRAGG